MLSWSATNSLMKHKVYSASVSVRPVAARTSSR